MQGFLTTAQAIERLLHPFAEIVLHDLQTNRVVAIFNSFSHRQIGDDSLLSEIEFDESKDIIGPYEKLNWDGRRLKSISVMIRDSSKKPVGLLCINLDISKFDECYRLLESLVSTQALLPNPQEIFKDDWQERINIFVHDYLRKQHKSLEYLSRADKQELVELLYQEGAFKQKNAANYVGKVLGIARATVYKYLSDVNTNNE
ncbi:PAS domain-containing protein [Oscillatoria sp. FACHB-1407]|nr:PAS domain-containing protein [Oscillatoria sp. FACHB-1407]